MIVSAETLATATWWHRSIPHTRAELIADALVHALGLLVALTAGGLLLLLAGEGPSTVSTAVAIYVGSLCAVLTISLAFNLWPITPFKRLLARIDQAAIFLLIAGTYTPILALLSDTPVSGWMTILVWGSAIVGIALKLIIPQHFGRLALLLYLGIGFSGVLVFQTLSETLPPTALWLLIAGGVTYSAGIVFHLWERLRFHSALWHAFVVVGASLHLLAMLNVFSR
jgi:hemolysin III